MPESDSVDRKQAEFLRRIAAGDRAALADLYDQTAPALFSYAVYTLENPQDAEEVIQDVFVQIWTKASTFNPGLGLPFHWIMGITRNRCIDRLRAGAQEQPEDLEEPVDVDDTISRLDESMAVHEALAILPDSCQDILDRFFARDESYRTIGEALDLPSGTIASRISRCLAKLRVEMEGRNPEAASS